MHSPFGMPLRWRTHFSLPILYMLSAIVAHGAEFGTFDEEARRFSSEAFCPTATVTPLESSGRVFGCVLGEFATVQFSIQELGRTGRVENVKVMWNDYLIDLRRGVHVARFEAKLLVKMTARLYAGLACDQGKVGGRNTIQSRAVYRYGHESLTAGTRSNSAITARTVKVVAIPIVRNL